jgi:Fic family protein
MKFSCGIALRQLLDSGIGRAVRVGNLVPPPVPQVPPLMADLERFVNEDATLPPLIKAGLAHVQFETIHPFLDGNGRMERLLIVLMFMDSSLLKTPILYPSYYFKKYQLDYYRYLDGVRLEGDFEAWLSFYLKGIYASSGDAYHRLKAIEELEYRLKERLRTALTAKKEELVQ